MEQFCPSNKEVIRQVEQVLQSQIKYDTSINAVINRVDEGEGILLRSGKRLSVSKQGGKKTRRKGGMFSRKRFTELENNIKSVDKSNILNGLSHIITSSIFASLIAGSATMAVCYLNPAVKAYLTTWGWLPTLCSETPASIVNPSSWTGPISWALQEIIGITGYGDTCSVIKDNFAHKTNLINWTVNIFADVVSGSLVFYSREKLYTNYIKIKDSIYFVLDTIINIITNSSKSAVSSSGSFLRYLHKIINNKLIVDKSLTPEQIQILSTFEKSVSAEVANEMGANEMGANEMCANEMGSNEEIVDKKEKTPNLFRTPSPNPIQRTYSPSPEPIQRTPSLSELIPNSMPATEEPEEPQTNIGGTSRKWKIKQKSSTRKKTINRRKNIRRKKSIKHKKSFMNTRRHK